MLLTADLHGVRGAGGGLGRGLHSLLQKREERWRNRGLSRSEGERVEGHQRSNRRLSYFAKKRCVFTPSWGLHMVGFVEMQ